MGNEVKWDIYQVNRATGRRFIKNDPFALKYSLSDGQKHMRRYVHGAELNAKMFL